MKFVTFLAPSGGARTGIMVGEDQILDLQGAAQGLGLGAPNSLLDLLDLGPVGSEIAATVMDRAQLAGFPTISSSTVRLVAPLPRPRKVLAVAGNYVDHIEEGGGKALAKSKTTIRPFIKPSNSVIGPDAPIRFPKWSTRLDYEAELAIVIGRTAKDVSPDEAENYIMGYSVFNDISGRSLTIGEGREERNGDWFFDWLAGKWFDTFAAFGPAIVTPDDIGDPQNLTLTLSLNGEPRQNTNTGQMIYDCFETVSFFSHLTTLEPGDIIATGTPAGVGSTTGRFLQPGDVIEASIDGIGTLRNPVEEEHS